MKPLAIAVLILASSQAICQDAKPLKTNHLPFLMDRQDAVLFAEDLTIRSLDMYTSNAAFRNPCRCYTESDPIAPTGTKGIIAFQLGAVALIQLGRYELERHHHRKLAKLVSLDVAIETKTVVSNFSH